VSARAATDASVFGLDDVSDFEEPHPNAPNVIVTATTAASRYRVRVP